MDSLLTNAFVVSVLKKVRREQDEKLNELKESIPVIQGPRGETGEQGPVGPMGPEGPPGIIGDSGPRGEKGDTGPQGERGEKGETGEQGPKGDRGDVGPKGPKGEKGDKGETGSSGQKGEKGERGERGPKGDKGDKGETGPMGPRGEQGLPGERGEKGEQGKVGPTGPQGEIGPKGDKGDPGQSVNKEELVSYINEVIDSTKTSLTQLQENYTTELGANTTEKFEEFKSKLRNDIDRVLEQHKKFIDMKVSQSGWGSTSSGGGSVNILQMDDVEFKKRHQVEGNAILIFDETKRKFVSESFTDIIERLKVDLEVQYDRLVDTEGDYTYIGEALPGSARDAVAWRIKRVYEQGDDIEIIWADNTADFTKVWNDRATYEYN